MAKGGVNSTKRASFFMRVFDYSDNKESEVIKVEFEKKRGYNFCGLVKKQQECNKKNICLMFKVKFAERNIELYVAIFLLYQ